MSLDASILKRLAVLRLRPAAMAEVLSIIADIDQSPGISPDDTKARHANSQRRYKERQRMIQKVSPDGSPNAMSPIPPKDITPPSPHSKSALQRARATEFETVFWPAYPNKIGKHGRHGAMQAFVKARERASLGAILAGLQTYATKMDDRPWCIPATWLNQDRWLDEPATVRAAGRSNGQMEAIKGFFDDTAGCEERAGEAVSGFLPDRR